MTTKQNIVPSNSPRRVVLQHGILFRFGFEPMAGTGFSKVGEIVYPTPPTVEELRGVQQEYCREHSIDEPFNPADYGFEESV